VDENVDLKKSSVYIGHVILNELKRNGKISIIELHHLLKKKIGDVNYDNVMNSLVFLKICGLVIFDTPYLMPAGSRHDIS
jgi:hypothetical protein